MLEQPDEIYDTSHRSKAHRICHSKCAVELAAAVSASISVPASVPVPNAVPCLAITIMVTIILLEINRAGQHLHSSLYYSLEESLPNFFDPSHPTASDTSS